MVLIGAIFSSEAQSPLPSSLVIGRIHSLLVVISELCVLGMIGGELPSKLYMIKVVIIRIVSNEYRCQ